MKSEKKKKKIFKKFNHFIVVDTLICFRMKQLVWIVVYKDKSKIIILVISNYISAYT